MKTRSGKTYTKSNPEHGSTSTLTIKTLTTNPLTADTLTTQPESEYVDNTDVGLYEVNIDFDESIHEWLRNKRKLRNCTYEYKCMFVSSSGRQCTGKSVINRNCCWCHRKFDKEYM